MSDDRIDFSGIRFRKQDVGHSPRTEEGGTPFWGIVGGVLTALVLYGLLQSIVSVMMVRYAVGELERKLESLVPAQSDSRASAPPPPSGAQQRPAARALPVHLGPVHARKAGYTQACIGGYVSDRVDGGWSQTRQKCSAASE